MFPDLSKCTNHLQFMEGNMAWSVILGSNEPKPLGFSCGSAKLLKMTGAGCIWIPDCTDWFGLGLFSFFFNLKTQDGAPPGKLPSGIRADNRKELMAFKRHFSYGTRTLIPMCGKSGR